MNFREHELVALRDVWHSRLRKEGGSPDYDVRRIFREFSKIFHTPLHEVYDLPLDFVIRAWLEEVYEKYSDDDLRAEAVDLIRTPEELNAMKLREDEDDAYAYNALREETEAAKALKKLEDAMKVLKKLPSVFKPGGAEPEMTNVKPSKMKIEEGITMRFDPGLDVDDEDSFGILEDPKAKQKK